MIRTIAYLLINLYIFSCFSQNSKEIDLYIVRDSALLSFIDRHSQAHINSHGFHVLDIDNMTNSITSVDYSYETVCESVVLYGATIMNGHIYFLPQQISQQNQWSVAGKIEDLKLVLHDKDIISEEQMKVSGVLTNVPIYYTNDESFVRIIDKIRYQYETLWYYYTIKMHAWISDTTGKQVFGMILDHGLTYSVLQQFADIGDAVIGCYVSNNVTGFIRYNMETDKKVIKERFNMLPNAYLKLVNNYNEMDDGWVPNSPEGVFFVGRKPLGYYDDGEGFKEGVIHARPKPSQQ